MTMVAFHASKNRAVLFTDSLGSDDGGRRWTMVDKKAMVLPHLNAVQSIQGPLIFSMVWRETSHEIAIQTQTFDAFVTEAAAALPKIWEGLLEWSTRADHGTSDLRTRVFLIGWSESKRRFKTYVFNSYDGWEKMDLTGAGVQLIPMPLTHRPGPVEWPLLRQQLTESPPLDNHGRPIDMVTSWERMPLLTKVPKNLGEWIALLEDARQSRSFLDYRTGLNFTMAGDVTCVRLERDSPPHVEVVHTLPTEGPEFDRMVFQSFPLSESRQRSPCAICDGGMDRRCGQSGEVFAQCLLVLLAGPCPCGTGREFRDCCSIYADEEATT